MNFENSVYDLLNALQQFDYQLDCRDHIWNIIFPDKKDKWHHLQIMKYQETYYIHSVDSEEGSLEVIPKKSVKTISPFQQSAFDPYEENIETWHPLITASRAWLYVVEKDWIKANKKVYENYPLNNRRGFVSNALIQDSLRDVYRIDKALGKAKTKKFIHLVESGYFRDENSTREVMTANDFFNYCKIAYIAGKRKEDSIDEHLSGRELYQCYADGRHEGLLDILPDSEQEFSEWIDGKHPKKTGGGHPWEIKRGGNTTHIDLYVMRPRYGSKEKFQITLRGNALSRLKETLCMFLAIHEAGLPIGIDNPEGIRQRLLAQDNVGIIPHYQSLHRANQLFDEKDRVFDVLHFDDLGRYKTRIKPFITWMPLPLLRTKKSLG